MFGDVNRITCIDVGIDDCCCHPRGQLTSSLSVYLKQGTKEMASLKNIVATYMCSGGG